MVLTSIDMKKELIDHFGEDISLLEKIASQANLYEEQLENPEVLPKMIELLPSLYIDINQGLKIIVDYRTATTLPEDKEISSYVRETLDSLFADNAQQIGLFEPKLKKLNKTVDTSIRRLASKLVNSIASFLPQQDYSESQLETVHLYERFFKSLPESYQSLRKKKIDKFVVFLGERGMVEAEYEAIKKMLLHEPTSLEGVVPYLKELNEYQKKAGPLKQKYLEAGIEKPIPLFENKRQGYETILSKADQLQSLTVIFEREGKEVQQIAREILQSGLTTENISLLKKIPSRLSNIIRTDHLDKLLEGLINDYKNSIASLNKEFGVAADEGLSYLNNEYLALQQNPDIKSFNHLLTKAEQFSTIKNIEPLIEKIKRARNKFQTDTQIVDKLEQIKQRHEESLTKIRDDLKETLEKKKHDADSWNHKYPTNEIVYLARDGRKWDVRDFIQADNVILKDLVEKEGLRAKTLDDIAYKCMRWVQENIKYTSDPQLTEHEEEWLFPTETRDLKKGDCEDGTNLIVSLMRNAGVPAFRVKNACGKVKSGFFRASGHSWPIYLRETDDEWVILDWCYKPVQVPIEKRELAKYRTDYKCIDFTFNDEHSWAQDSIELNKEYLHPNDAESVSEQGKDDSRQLEISPYFSLPLYIESIGYPSNFRYYALRRILSAKNGESSWETRFKRTQNEIETLTVSDQIDCEYLEKLAFGIDRTINSPPPNFSFDQAKKTYAQLKEVLTTSLASIT